MHSIGRLYELTRPVLPQLKLLLHVSTNQVLSPHKDKHFLQDRPTEAPFKNMEKEGRTFSRERKKGGELSCGHGKLSRKVLSSVLLGKQALKRRQSRQQGDPPWQPDLGAKPYSPQRASGVSHSESSKQHALSFRGQPPPRAHWLPRSDTADDDWPRRSRK